MNVKEKLLIIEYSIVNASVIHQDKLEAVKSLKMLLIQIDFKTEIVPLKNIETLISLFETLADRKLTSSEVSIIEEIKEP
ncbi:MULTISPECIES: hypothetical protein [Bizionia]|uniref:Uncharacterized protein n=1 Tax=Bizionia hallyeonensis TaxID=1123757 RepID=A0ABW0C358_9FLAO|nr:hypothetical protein [Bizionia sp. M204]UPS92990.1 hypothetical protein GMA17_15215 [Bizionia sp. M204]